jgi:GR25 family glycosyltransferase involved in LPS biosynthesis
MVDKYFDKIYVLNLKKRDERLSLTQKRLKFVEIENFTVFNGVDGSVMKRLWEVYSEKNTFFKNPNYIGCSLSHLSIYADAIEKGYQRILVIEDDNRIHRSVNSLMEKYVPQVPEWKDLLYLGFIPLSDDCSRWDYNIVSNFVNKNVFVAKNLWGLFAYGITQNLMKEMIEVYNKDFPMEIDRYFVTNIQPRGGSFGLTPQLFSADDGLSDNSGVVETGMLQRSVDTRFANLTDYI